MKLRSFLSPIERFYLQRYFHKPGLYLFRFSFAFMILGIVLSVGILGAGLNLFEGYERTLKTLLLDSMSHISIQNPLGENLAETDVERISKVLTAQNETASATGVLSSSVMAVKDGVVRGCNLKAYSMSSGEQPYQKYIQSGSAVLPPGHIIIGYHLAKELALSLGDTLQVVYPQLGRISAMGMYPGSRFFTIGGIYQSGYYEYDRSLLICNKENADELLSLSGQYSYIEVRLKTSYIDKAPKLASEYESLIGKEFMAVPWTVYNQGLFRLIVIEKWLIFIIFSFLVLISGLNVVSAVTTVLYDRKNEIAILKTIGTTDSILKKLLYHRLAFTGITAILLGQIFGMLLSWAAVKQNFYTLKGDVYFIDRLVMHISPLNQLIIFVSAAFIVIICIRVPLARINRMEIIEILRQK